MNIPDIRAMMEKMTPQQWDLIVGMFCGDTEDYLEGAPKAIQFLLDKIGELEKENSHLKDDGPDWYYKTCVDDLKLRYEAARNVAEGQLLNNHLLRECQMDCHTRDLVDQEISAEVQRIRGLK